MLNLNCDNEIFLACGATDMRKSINGLCEIVKSTFNLDPYVTAYFVFCNGQKNRLKILTWEENGFWLHFKRLEQGRFTWPEAGPEETMSLSSDELNLLIKTPAVKQKIQRKELFCDRRK